MTKADQYIDIMIEGLRKKIALLDQIMESSRQLEQAASVSEMDLDQFKELLDEKDEYVSQINQMDTGFQSLFDKVKEELHKNKQMHKPQIQEMQQLIREITDRTVQIQEMEAKNQLLIEGQFGKMRKNVHVAKQGMNVAQNYYKSMTKMNVVDSQFMDKRN